MELAVARDERDAAINRCETVTREERSVRQAHVDLAVESARSAQMRVEETWGAQTAQLLQVCKDSTAIMGEQLRVAAATPRPLARVLVAEAAVSGLLSATAFGGGGAGNGSPTGLGESGGKKSSSKKTNGFSPPTHTPSAAGTQLPVSQTLGDSVRQSGALLNRLTARPNLLENTSSSSSSSSSSFSLRRPDPTLSHTLPLGGDTQSLYRSYASAVERSERAGLAEVERVVIESDRLLSSHNAAGGAALRDMERLNVAAGEEISALRTSVSALSTSLAASQRSEKLALAAALASPLGITLGATKKLLAEAVGIGSTEAERKIMGGRDSPSTTTATRSNRRSPSPSPSSHSQLHPSQSARPVDPIAGAPSPWPASYASASVLASPVKWRPAKAGAFPTPRTGVAIGGGVSVSSPSLINHPPASVGGFSKGANTAATAPTMLGGAAPPTLTEMLATISSGRSESLGVPVAVAVSASRGAQYNNNGSGTAAAAQF